MKRSREGTICLILLQAIILFALGTFGIIYYSSEYAQSATTQDVTVNATPAYITISNSPTAYDFGTIATSSTANTGNDYFSITNGSTVNIDVSVNCSGWSSGGSAWTYNNPASNTGNLDCSSGEGGTGGSSGSGAYDISILDSGDTLLCDNVTTVTDPQWELQLDAPSAFTHGDEQETTVTLTATQE